MDDIVMNRKARTAAVAMSIALAAASAAAAAQSLDKPLNGTATSLQEANPSATNRVGSWQNVSEYLRQTVRDGILTGYGFAVFNDDGVLFQQAGGDQNLWSVEPLASASKLPAVAAIMTLVDQGKLDLDEPVSAYLKGNLHWPAGKRDITLRMLLSHTAGLPGNEAPASITPSCLTDTKTTLRHCAQQIADLPLLHKPGTVFAYTSADIQIAGYIAVEVSGSRSWQQFFYDAIAAPLHWYSYSFSPAYTDNPLIGGGASSNLGDYVNFLGMILDRGMYHNQRVLSEQAVAQIEKNEMGNRVAFSPMPPVQYPGYGMGVFMSASDLYPGSPGPEFSDPGLYGSVPWYDRGLNYGAVLLIVDTDTTGVDVWNGLRPLIITQLTQGN